MSLPRASRLIYLLVGETSNLITHRHIQVDLRFGQIIWSSRRQKFFDLVLCFSEIKLNRNFTQNWKKFQKTKCCSQENENPDRKTSSIANNNYTARFATKFPTTWLRQLEFRGPGFGETLFNADLFDFPSFGFAKCSTRLKLNSNLKRDLYVK